MSGDDKPTGLQTCPREGCPGHGRPLWRTHEFCPWCRGPLVTYSPAKGADDA